MGGQLCQWVESSDPNGNTKISGGQKVIHFSGCPVKRKKKLPVWNHMKKNGEKIWKICKEPENLHDKIFEFENH